MKIVFVRKNLIKKPVEMKKRAFDSYLARLLAKWAARQFYGLKNTGIIEEKKPHFAENGVYFSISHSHNLVAVALDTADIGFDIELMNDRDFSAIAQRMGWGAISTKQEFYKAWTIYEAQVKQKSTNTQSFLFEDYAFSVSSNSDKDIKGEVEMLELTIENEQVSTITPVAFEVLDRN